ncbi:MAG: PQQ-dependent sugar dehydrogenase [Chitinophagaceae bacterium]|nr:PQQ-dependent sugar dehydrogenase [Chitinophagaceae bacterium]
MKKLFIVFFSLIVISGCKKFDAAPPDSLSVTQSDELRLSKDIDLKLVADNFVSPVALVDAPDGSKRLFVVDQVGKVWIIDRNGKILPEPFIDITSKIVTLQAFYDERGLLGLAFHPHFKYNGKFYLFYNAPPPPGGPTTDAGNTGLPKIWNSTVRISEFRVSGNRNGADMGYEKVILEEAHPQFNHNGGTIA